MTDTLVRIGLADVARTALEHRSRLRLVDGETMTDEACRAHAALVADELRMAGVEDGPRAWWTAQRLDGRICGIWAYSWHEAALRLSFAGALSWLVEDSDLRVRDEYEPVGVPGSVFPVTPAPMARADRALLVTPADALF